MATWRAPMRRITTLSLASLAACSCGRTELDTAFDETTVNLGPKGGTTYGMGGSVVAAGGSTSGGHLATGGRASGGHFATGGATGGRASGGYVATGGATGGLASGGHFATGGATGGRASGGYVATGGATGGFTGAGGAATVGGATSLTWSTVTSRRASYVCQAAAPIEQSPCACDELPCDCSYSSRSISIGNVCPQGRLLCEYGSGIEYACLGGVWRVIAGGGGSGCYCGDPTNFFGTGGASSTGGATSMGGTSANSTGTVQAGASSTGGTSGTTAPIITSSGGAYSCPTTEPYQQQIACPCSNPPCECDYTYAWTETSSCSDAHRCSQRLSFDYTCQDGFWQGLGPTWGTDCNCEIGDAGI